MNQEASVKMGKKFAALNFEEVEEISQRGTVEFSSEITKSLNFTAEHMENAKAPENK